MTHFEEIPQTRCSRPVNQKGAEGRSHDHSSTPSQIDGNPVPIDFDCDLLKAVIELLPLGLTIADRNGRIVLANEIAGIHAAHRAFGTNDAPAAASHPPPEAAATSGRIGPGAWATAEEKLVGPDGERTILTWHRPAIILDQPLLVSTALDITHRKQVESELARRANFDELTGLPNRTRIQEHVEDLIQRRGRAGHFALAFLDLDEFKHINDYYGHAIGDALLVKLAERITGLIQASDMFARISGDEFVLLFDPIESPDHLQTVIENLLEELKQPFHVEGFEVFASASVGLCIYPQHGESYEALRRNADTAMYRAKSTAKGGAELFDIDMEQAVAARVELEQRLRLAIRDRKFRCAFQPKVDLRTQEVVGFEALVRWCDEDGAIQAPSDFIALAVELGLIDSITRFVLEDAIGAIEELDCAFGDATTMSINVAAKQAGDLKFMRSLTEWLKGTPYAHRFILELTEDAFLAKGDFQSQVLPTLRDIGVRVSIDDFGTGYSSLSVLADITADEIKVDRSFITAIHQRPRSQGVLKAIESLSHALGMTVIAEGVETFEELAYLQAATRIRYAQGFYFSKPFLLEELGHARHLGDARIGQASREATGSRRGRAGRTAPEAPSRRG